MVSTQSALQDSKCDPRSNLADLNPSEMSDIKAHFKSHPLQAIILLALTLRILAAFFAKGYMMHDDHFLIIETSAGWADGHDYNNWLPWSPGCAGPSGHSFFYPGIHFLIFKIFNFIGLHDPQTQMLFIRLLHALYSLLIVTLGYKIAVRLAGEKTALRSALVLAVLAFLPNFSVRNLVEMASIPPLIAAVLSMMNFDQSKKLKHVLWAGLWVGIAAGIRYQTGLFGAGLGLFLLWQKEWRGALVLAASFALTFFLTQATDLFIWHRPFAELTEYVRYNFTSGGEYVVLPWYTYLLTIAGYLVPPFSLILVWGFAKNARKHLITFLPVIVFILVHSIIGNKQERFILPVLPFIIISGLAYWQSENLSEKLRKVLRAGWVSFWVLNTMGLAILTFSYGKKARVEAMYFLYKNQVTQPVVIEYSFREEVRYPPQFYSGIWGKYYLVDKGTNLTAMSDYLTTLEPEGQPAFALFYENIELAERTKRFEEEVRPLSFEAKIEPSWFDRLLHLINPNNRLEEVFIYRVQPAHPTTEGN